MEESMEDLNIKDLLYSLWKNKIMIIIVVIIGVVLGFVYSKFIVDPEYKSITTIVLSKSSNISSDAKGSSETITTNDVTLNQKLVSTYGEIIKSRSIAREVIQKLNLSIKEEDLIKKISVQSKKDTELLEIAVVDEVPNVASDIANTISQVFAEKIKDVYNIDNVSVIDKAEPSEIPYNINLVKTIIIFILGSGILAVGIVIIKEYMNNTIKTQDEVEKLLNLPVIAVIPEIKD